MRNIVLSRITQALFYVSEVVSALVLRWPLKVWGPPSLLAYRPIFASWWRYAWMKTRQRGLNSTWLCQFWRKCRTNELPSCAWTSHPSWWCGAYQYCLKLLLLLRSRPLWLLLLRQIQPLSFFFIFIFKVMSHYSRLFWSAISASWMSSVRNKRCRSTWWLYFTDVPVPFFWGLIIGRKS